MDIGQLGKFRLLHKIATGGMGELFLARHVDWPESAEPVVLKRILPHLSRDEKFIGMFMQEARLAADFNHKNLVKVLDFGKEDDTFYMTMQYHPGQTLDAVLRKLDSHREVWDYECGIHIVKEILDGLWYIHSIKDDKGRSGRVIHLDINPGNILISPGGQVKILDFGVAQSAIYGSLCKQERNHCGTPGYMSPEQYMGDELSAASDLYSVGIILYECTVLQPLFSHQPSDPSVIAAVTNGIIKKPRMVDPDFPEKLEGIIMKSLAVKPQKRFSGAREFRTALLEAARSLNYNVTPQRLAQALNKLPQSSEEDIRRRTSARAGLRRDAVLTAFTPEFRTESHLDDVEFPQQMPSADISRAVETENRKLKIAFAVFGILLALICGTFGYEFVQSRAASEIGENRELTKLEGQGRIYVDTIPSGARIMISSRDITGSTPVEVDGLELNRDLDVEIFLEGYKPRREVVRLSSEAPADALLIRLEKEIK